MISFWNNNSLKGPQISGNHSGFSFIGTKDKGGTVDRVSPVASEDINASETSVVPETRELDIDKTTNQVLQNQSEGRINSALGGLEDGRK